MIYECSVCSESFVSLFKLRAHYITHPAVSLSSDTSKPSNDVKLDSCESGASPDTLNQKEKNAEHDSTFTHHNANETSLSQKETKIKKKVQVNRCTTCGTMSRQKHFRKRHKCFLTKDKTFRCAICEKTFSTQSNLSRHIKTHLDHY